MASKLEETGDPQTQETEQEFFDNDSQLESELLAKFSKTEEPEEATEEEETEEETEEVEPEATEEEEVTEEESEEAEPEFTEKEQKAWDKRIQRELRKLNKQAEEKQKEFDEKLSQLDQKLQEAATPTSALERVKTTTDIDALEKLEEEAEKTIDFVEEHPDGVTLNEGTDKEQYLDRSELLDYRKNARQTLKQIKLRRKFIEEKSRNDEAIYQSIPALKDKSSEEMLAVNSVYGIFPELKNHPQGLYAALCLLKGEQAYNAMQDQPKKKSKQPKAPRLPDAEPPAKKPAGKQKAKIDLQSIIEQGGDSHSLEEALLS
jgi:hypothetical protein